VSFLYLEKKINMNISMEPEEHCLTLKNRWFCIKENHFYEEKQNAPDLNNISIVAMIERKQKS
jgi:hypothetical protein